MISVASASDAIIAYRSNTGVNTLNSPKIRFWNSSLNGSWGSEIELPAATAGITRLVVKQSPVSSKIVLVTAKSSGLLDAYVCTSDCSNALSWTVSSIGDVSAVTQRRFDVEFETATGNAIVVYGVVSANATRDLAYKVLPAGTSSFTGIPEQYIDDTGNATDLQYTWVRLDRKPSGSELLLTAFDGTNNHINAWVWNGSVWNNQIGISSDASGSSGREALAVRYSADGSKGMVLGVNGTTGYVNYTYWNGSAWSALLNFDIYSGDDFVAQWLNLKADPSTDDLQALIIDDGFNLHTAYWNGSTWNITSNIDTDVDVFSTRDADFAWEPSGSKGRLVWETDSGGTSLSQRNCTPQCTSPTTTISTYGGNGRWLTLYSNPANSDAVDMLGVRLNSVFNLSSFAFNGTAYANYGDSAISNSTTVSTYEAYSIAFLPQASISNCPVIASAGSYVMPFNFMGAPNSASPLLDTACVKITASNVVFDCNGFNITNNGTTGTTYGILLSSSLTNVTVKNCHVSNYSYGIYSHQSNSSNFTNNTAYNNTQYGIYLDSSSNNTLAGNVAYNNSVDGFYLNSGANNSLTGNIANNNSRHGITIQVSSGNTLIENEAHNNTRIGFIIWTSPNTTLAGNNISDNRETGLFISRYSNYITAFNNTVYGNAQHGVLVADSNYTNFTDNSVYGNGNDGFYILSYAAQGPGPYIISLAGNSIHDNAWNGIEISRAYDVAIANGTVHGNQLTGISITNSNISGGNLHLYNNSNADLYVESASPGYHVNLTNVSVDNPTGDFTNYTSLTVADETPSGNTNYQIGWNAEPAGLLPGYFSFAQKYVNISTSIPAGAEIDSIRFNWLVSELSGYNESNFELWNYNGSWLMTSGQALDVGGNYIENLDLSVLSNGSVYGILQSTAANLSILKLDQTALQPSPGGIVQFNITITNTGNVTLNPVEILDELPSGLNYSAASPVPDSVLGQMITWSNVGPLVQGDFVVIYINSTVDAGIVNPGTPELNLTNTVNVTGVPPNGDNVTAQDEANVTIYYAEVGVLKVDITPSPPSPGGIVQYSINVTNTGKVQLDPVAVVDTLPAGFSFSSSSPTADSVIGQTITWNNIGHIAADSSVVIYLNATVDPGAANGTYTNSVNVIGVPPNGDNVTASDDADVGVYSAALNIVKTASNYNPAINQRVLFTLNITNTGQVNLTITAMDVLPGNMSFVDGSPPPTFIAGQTVYWDSLTTLQFGESILILYNITVNGSGAYANNATAYGVPPNGNNATDSDSVAITVNQPPPSDCNSARGMALRYDLACPGNI
ncbi:right-handed parallel beta-helix repeat-containing protein, partial [Candidatus Micrarchaeota archaeon]|nr:right-handed parallel beta-helix repeat-containing protein [Candidatus Micrarchaeota archaeon]